MEAVEVKIPERMNAAEIFVDENVKRGLGDKVAIYFAGEPPRYKPETLTYRQVQELVNRTGNALRSLGVDLEDRVMMIMLDTPAFIATFFGAIKIGAIPVPVNTMLTPKEYEYMLNDSRAKVLVVNEELAKFLDEVRPNLKYLKHVIVLGEPKGDQLSYDELVKSASPELEPVELSKDDFCFWLYSSGTTGPPKGVVHLQHDMLYSAETYARHVLNMTEKDICFSASKLFFAYGLGNAMYFPFRFGASSVLYPGRPEPEKMFEIIEKYRVTIFFGVPLLYARMLEVPDAEKRYDLSSLRLCVSAGEALPAIIYHRWKEKFKVDILDGIGTTEATHIFISNRPGKIKPGSSGVPVPGYEVKLVDDEGKEVGTGQVGRLLVKGDSIAAFYWNKHEKTKKTFLGEWLDTGDMYVKDEEGFYTHVGRADDMIKSGGIWVSPVEVEATLMEHPAVAEAAAVQGYTSEGLGRVKAYVVLKPGYTPSKELEEELKEFVKSRIAPYKRPEWIEFVDELPKTATGKIQRYKLRLREREKLMSKA